jgi:hypothetical protein
MPLEATQHTDRGARAFAAFFIKTIDWGYATTSSAYMRHYFDPKTCVACKSVADAIDSASHRAHHFRGDRFTIDRLTNPRFKVKGTIAELFVVFDVSKAEVLDEHGNTVSQLRALTDYREDMDLQWRSTKWVLALMTPRG